MPRKLKAPSFERLRDQLELAMCGNYETWSARADACLRIVKSADNVATRRKLWAHLLSHFRLIKRPLKPGRLPMGMGVSDELYKDVQRRISDLVTNEVGRLLTANRSLTSTATHLMQFIQTLADDDERRVALSVIFRSPLLPYAQIPRDLCAQAARDLEKVGFERANLPSLALIARLVQSGKYGQQEQIAALAKLMRKAPNEQTAQYLMVFMMSLWERQSAVMPQGTSGIILGSFPLGGLGEALGEAFRDFETEIGRRAALECSNPDCPIHGKGKKDKPETKPS